MDELSRDFLFTLRADIMLNLEIITEINFNILEVILIGSLNMKTLEVRGITHFLHFYFTTVFY